MRRAIPILLLVVVLLVVFTAPAFAHVHGITPLLDCTVDNSNSGALGANGTPADAANEGPITGLIPRDVGNAPLTGGDGGFSATDGHCP